LATRRAGSIAGDQTGGTPIQFRNYFVFDLPNITEQILSAQLSFYNPSEAIDGEAGYLSSNPTETYQITNVTTPLGTLQSGNVGEPQVFADLATNTVWGSVSVSSADDGQMITITLDSAAIKALNPARGGEIALGGRILGLPLPAQLPDRYVFGGTNGGAIDPTQLVMATTQRRSPFHGQRFRP
jgi:hypothetical protein